MRAALTHSRKVVARGAGVVLDAERYTDSGRGTRVWLSQNRGLGRGQGDIHVGQVALSDVLVATRPPVPAGDGGDSPSAKNVTQSDHDVRLS